MEIETIVNGTLYSIKFDNKKLNEFEIAFKLWKDMTYLSDFFESNHKLYNSEFWHSRGFETIDDATAWIANDALELKKLVKLAVNSLTGQHPDLEDYFEPLMGQYSYVHQLVPSKGYGVKFPSMIRIYAIKIEINCCLMVHGGIKLTADIAGMPDLKAVLFSKIDSVVRFLKENAIDQVNDLNE